MASEYINPGGILIAGRLDSIDDDHKRILVFSNFVGWHTLTLDYYQYTDALVLTGTKKCQLQPSLLDKMLYNGKEKKQ